MSRKAQTRLTLTAAFSMVIALGGVALGQDIAPLSNNPTRQGIVQQAEQTPPGENQEVYSDPLAPFNEAMFTFNIKLDDWVLRPVAKGYSFVAPEPVRKHVGEFFDNVSVI